MGTFHLSDQPASAIIKTGNGVGAREGAREGGRTDGLGRRTGGARRPLMRQLTRERARKRAQSTDFLEVLLVRAERVSWAATMGAAAVMLQGSTCKE